MKPARAYSRIPRHEIEELCRRADLKGMIGRRVTLDEHRGGSYWTGHCPFHDDSNPSFAVYPNSQQSPAHFYCFTCEEKGNAIGWLMKKEGMTFLQAVDHLRRDAGLRGLAEVREDVRRAELKRHQRGMEEMHRARRNWTRTTATHPLLLTYWHDVRGITDPPPASVRFLPRCYCKEIEDWLPALVAGFQDVSGQFAGIHRIWLDPKTGEKAKLKAPKKSQGHCRGAAIRLAEATHRLAIAEGIETGASVQELSGWPVWVTPTLRPELPLHVRELTIAGDNDGENGEGQKKARRAADHFMRLGLTVRIAIPDAMPGRAKTDWNDTLQDLFSNRKDAA